LEPTNITPETPVVEEKFCHLHNHSYYSLLDGLSSIKDLVGTAKACGYKSLALTDHGSCAGLYNFQKECKDQGIKPILGMEAYISPDHTKKDKDTEIFHLVLLAKNKVGYQNLIFLSSFAYTQGFYRKPRIDFDILSKHHEGLIVTSACCSGEISSLLWSQDEASADKLAMRYKEMLGDDFYLEIMVHKYQTDMAQQDKEKKLAGMIYKMSKRLGIKAICTNDTHYARKAQWEAQDVLLSIQTLDTIKNPDRMTFGSQDFYLKSPEEMAVLYKSYPDLLANTLEIANKIETGLIVSAQDLLPTFKVPDGSANEEAYLKSLVTDGMKKFGLIDKPKYRERVKYEMSVILKCHYEKYFLILWDIINFANTQGIRVGAGRGSAVSSLVLYVLGITKLDPLKYNLIFERFLNPDRVSPPDVDVDFDYFRREEVYNYIIRKYGAEYCSQIGTYNRFKAKAIVRSAAKALDIGKDWETYQEAMKKYEIDKAKPENANCKIPKPEMTKESLNLADKIAKLIPNKPNMTIETACKSKKDGEIFKKNIMRYSKLFEMTRGIEGTISSAGIHPAGIIVCKNPVMEVVPLRSSHGVVCTQFEGPEAESLGLLKFDLLALKTLTVLDNTVKMIKARHGKDIDIDRLEPNDPKVFSIFNGTHPCMGMEGIFQFEASQISKLLKNVRVDTFEDMIVVNALYRPGPLGEGLHDTYCNYKHNKDKIEYLHPKMGEVLKDTYGIMVYQENIMDVSRVLAGFTGGQADTLRKVVGKKKPELIKKEKLDEKFIDGCVKNGISKEIATKIFDQICYFAGYGFNKSHSASYAFIAYQCGWLKYYYPIEFMCNLLSSEIQNNDKDEKLNGYRRAVTRMGIAIDPIDINKSGTGFKIETAPNELKGKNVDYLREPLSCAEGAGAKAVENIVKNQPYENLADFIRKVDARIVNIRVFTSLVKGKCFDAICGPHHDKIMKAYAEAKEKLDKEKKELQRQQKRAAKEGKGSIFDEAKPEECNNSESESMDIEVTEEFDPSNKNIDF